MKITVYILCLWALGAHSFSAPESRVMYGYEAQLGQFPWQVALFTLGGKCGGSLIHPNWVLTAHHCLVFGDAINLTFANINYYEPGELQRTASKIILHEGYEAKGKKNDVGLIYIEDPVPESRNIRIIRLSNPDHYVREGEVLTISGFGFTENGSNDVLRYRHLYAWDNKKCEVYIHNVPDDKRLCTEGYACYGDSGGPLVQWNGEEYIQVGIASFSYCKPPELPTGFARVASYRDWIARNTNNAV